MVPAQLSNRRTELGDLLESILGSDHIYFQPPASITMAYPCIRYELDAASTIFADNNPYRNEKRYKLTVIDRDPDSLIPDEIAKLQKCRFDRHFVADNLNHFVFNIYF